jgi:hypothetical protein
MNRSKVLALLPFVSFFAMGGYLFLLRGLGDPRAQDLALEGSEMRWFEIVWLIYTLCGVLFIWLRSMWRSYHARQIGWLIGILLAWPAAAFYVWRQE